MNTANELLKRMALDDVTVEMEAIIDGAPDTHIGGLLRRCARLGMSCYTVQQATGIHGQLWRQHVWGRIEATNS